MSYMIIIFMLGCGYYTFTYARFLWREEKNKLGAVAAFAASLIGVAFPAFVLIIKS